MKRLTLSVIFVLTACGCLMSCSKKETAPAEVIADPGPMRIESTLNQTKVDQDYIVKGQYWYVDDEDTVAMICYEGNYDMKLDFTPEQQALIDGLDDSLIYDITFTAKKFSGEPTETEGVLIAVEPLPSEEETPVEE